MSQSSPILAELNAVQRQVVSSDADNLLVVAGAGSGKTRVLTSRIAWLIREQGVSPFSILAVTFTNKAAREMSDRVEGLLGGAPRGLLVGTFHSVASRLLRIHHAEAGLSPYYQILDATDQLRLIKRTLRDKECNEERYPPKKVRYYINHFKEEGMRPDAVVVDKRHDAAWLRVVIDVYRAYEEACARSELVDFAELLLRACELWDNEEVLARYRQRFEHVLVDEFQDTNTLQYRWLRALHREGQCTMAVGDDDQSIYGWRGARIEHIQEFQDNYPTQLFRLEQNYRSTGNILNAANALIRNNTTRLGKELWTEDEGGDPLALYPAYNEHDEARFMVEHLQKWHTDGGEYADMAVLYRSNVQSRVLEGALLEQKMPYRIYGGLRFYERSEIKDVLAYLRLIVNRNDDLAFVRAVGIPTRGVGAGSLERLRIFAAQHGGSLWQAAQQLLSEGVFSTKIGKALKAFMVLIEDLSALSEHKVLTELVEIVLDKSGLKQHYEKDEGEVARNRLENLEELVNACGDYDKGSPNPLDLDEEQDTSEPSVSPRPSLERFLGDVLLDADQERSDAPKDHVSLMTIHAAKGLEFSVVFMVGMEEGLFPHARSIEDGDVEEERRLCYVGITRARKKLYLSHAKSRRLYKEEKMALPSCFIKEIPEECLEHLKPKRKEPVFEEHFARRSQNKSRAHTPVVISQHAALTTLGEYSVGARVSHAAFGDGVITHLEGRGEHARANVRFKKGGSKWLVLSYARLSVLSS